MTVYLKEVYNVQKTTMRLFDSAVNFKARVCVCVDLAFFL